MLGIFLSVVLGVVVFVAVLVAIGINVDENSIRGAIANMQSKIAPKTLPTKDAVIGYKKARFCGPDGLMPFKGVVGVPYGVVGDVGSVDAGMSSYTTRGFHMYRRYEDALHHPQDGDILLEVVAYGNVDVYEDGYISSKQRVVQMIVGGCEHGRYLRDVDGSPDCPYPATGWRYWDHAGDGPMDRAGGTFMCEILRKASAFRYVSNSKWISLADIEQRIEESTGHRVAVRSRMRPSSGLVGRLAQGKSTEHFVPVKELIAETEAAIARLEGRS